MRSEVPTGWASPRLADLCEPKKTPVLVDAGTTYQEIGIRSHGKGVFVKAPTTGEKLGNKRVFFVEPDAFVANIVFAWEGAMARTTRDHSGLIASHRFPMWRPRPDRLDLDYLVYFMGTPSGLEIASNSSPGGAGRNRTLNQTAFLNTRLPLPPLPEQKKIAAILLSVDEAIQATRAVIEQGRRVKEGLLQELLTRGIGHTRFQQTPIGEIPEGWEVRRLGQVMEIQLGKMLSPKAKTGLNPRPYLRNVNIQWDGITTDDVLEMDFDDREQKKFRLRPGDILMCEGGQIGRCAIWRGDLEECYYQKALHRLRPKNGALLPEYALAFFNRHFRWGISTFVESGGTTFAHLTREKLQRLPISVPPIREQAEIVGVIASVDSSNRSSGHQQRRMAKTKSGLLQDLLTGKVRVTP